MLRNSSTPSGAASFDLRAPPAETNSCTFILIAWTRLDFAWRTALFVVIHASKPILRSVTQTAPVFFEGRIQTATRSSG
jgi:hypothetical protein